MDFKFYGLISTRLFYGGFNLKAQYYVLLAIAFLMPFYRILIPPLLVAWILLWIFEGNLMKKLTTAFTNPVAVLLMLFYAIHLVGMLWTSDRNSGWFDLEIKLSLFFFPLLLFGSPYFFRENYHHLLWSFVTGNFVSCLICFGYAFYRSSLYHSSVWEHDYSMFSLFLHPSYGALYVLFSACILIYFLLKKERLLSITKISLRLTRTVLAVILIIFILSMYLYSSRAGLLSSILVFAILITHLFFLTRLSWLIKGFLLVTFCTIAVWGLKNNPRFKAVSTFLNSREKISYQTTENVSTRYLIILETLDVLKQNLWTGTGTGDVKDALREQYKKKQFTFALEKDLNVHNQFLETTLALGIFGGICLSGMILLPLISGIKHNNSLAIFFFGIVTVNFLFESMLNTQGGVVFYAFFNSLVLLNVKKE